MMTKDAHAIGKEGRGDGLFPTGHHRVSIPGKLKRRLILYWKDRVFADTVLRHADASCYNLLCCQGAIEKSGEAVSQFGVQARSKADHRGYYTSERCEGQNRHF
jgi:hypothetical protein